ncbi:hypothetical protein [Shimazuella alba]|uniref:Uncharacterized protein n=1 Tax=Shimazuella alba TaxID=2690964 RepID=A0A6I4VYD6_9BACL|nr:hypothetical protein [Shimazuella alba]MXQ55873.1 hypothetical protein [Shimazuella alba]
MASTIAAKLAAATSIIHAGGSATGKYQMDVDSPRETIDMFDTVHELAAAGKDQQAVALAKKALRKHPDFSKFKSGLDEIKRTHIGKYTNFTKENFEFAYSLLK